MQAKIDEARYEGGEQLLEQTLPPNTILPDIGLREVIAAGVEAMRPRLVNVLDAQAVYNEIKHALNEGLPFSMVRLGDGELLALAQDTVYPAGEILERGPFLPYAGIHPPNLAARDELAQAIRNANLVGVPVSRRIYFGQLLHPALNGLNINLRSLRLCRSTVNYELHEAGLLPDLIRGRKLLLVGNKARGLAQRLGEKGFTVTAVISPVRGFLDIGMVMEEVRKADFDLALIAAGIPAVVLASRIAAEMKKTALDIGHMADRLVDGRAVI
ncbi:hypothetical protein VN24_01880 [Paenibacillus beijingensis]|uniref:GT-D fold-like domain-containing protein n=1 Tax=Paenibacillus beijingensis TaxID=1126833 RepID=A0A0D5NQH3_9BACL|nr:hypothetical protein VN24_01880 [Paenibacillus beijingensis]